MESEPFRELMKLLPPPPVPKHAKGDWQAVERQYGFTFPADYKRFVETYGKGLIEPVGIWLINPFHGPIRLEDIREQHLRQTAGAFPFTFFPAADGLFPWGGSNCNHYFFWRTKDGVSSSEIVATLDCCEWAVYGEQSFVAFLLSVLKQSNSEIDDKVLEPLQLGDAGEFTFESIA